MFTGIHLQFGRDYIRYGQIWQDDFRKCNQAGRTSGCVVLFLPTKILQVYFMDYDPIGSICQRIRKFVAFMTHFITTSHLPKGTSTMLLLDNHALYLSLAAIDMSAEIGVTLLSFPPHCNHGMQPLDIFFYSRPSRLCLSRLPDMEK